MKSLLAGFWSCSCSSLAVAARGEGSALCQGMLSEAAVSAEGKDGSWKITIEEKSCAELVGERSKDTRLMSRQRKSLGIRQTSGLE